MADNKDVELRIRARDYSQKTFKELTKVYQALIRVQEEQAEAARKGEGSARDLESTYRRLDDVGRQLLKLDALTKVQQKQSAALAEAAEKAAKTRNEYQRLKAEYTGVESATKRQTAALAAANRAQESAAKAEERRRKSLANTSTQLERYGITTQKLAGYQAGIVTGVSQVNAALDRQDAILSSLTANKAAAAARDQAKKTAEAEAAAVDKVVKALQRQADQALAAGRGYRTLGRVVNQTTVSYGTLGKTVQTIIAPAAQARTTLGGLEAQVAETAKNVDTLSRSATEAKSALRNLGDAQRAAAGMANLIDQFRRQNSQIRDLRGQYNSARGDLRSLSAQLRTTGVDHQSLAAQVQQAQQRINAVSAALRDETNAARSTQAALRAAGMDTRNLADAQNRLIQTTQSTVVASDRLARSVRQKNTDTQNAAKWTDHFTKGNRESLSMIQRVRGEIIALATAYVGLQGAINLAGGAVDTFKVRERAMIRAEVYAPGASREEWEYIIGLADALSIRLTTLADTYSKFATSAVQTGLSVQEARYIFEAVGKAGRVMQLGDEDMKGVFRALEQMLSKGQVYAEELRQQLGERLPAAVATFAKGMGVPIDQFLKMMEQGQVTAKEVLNFATALNESVADQLDRAMDGVLAAEARLATAQDKFKLTVADAGFIDAYTDMLTKLTTFLASDKGVSLAENLAKAFAAVADAIIWAADNSEQLIAVLGTLVAIKVGLWLGAMVVSILKAAKATKDLLGGLAKTTKALTTKTAAVGKASGAIGGLMRVMRLLMRVIPGVGALLIAWDIGKIVYNQSDTAKSAIDSLLVTLKTIPTYLEAALRSVPALLKDLTFGPLSVIEQALRDGINALVRGLENLAQKIPVVGDRIGQALRRSLSVAPGENRGLFKETAEVWKEAFEDIDRIKESAIKRNREQNDAIIKQTVDFARGMQAATASIKQGTSPLMAPEQTGIGLPLMDKKSSQLTPGTGPLMPQNTSFQFTENPGTAPTPRMRLIRELTGDFEKLQKAAEKANKTIRENLARRDLAGRLSLVDEEFAPLFTKAQDIGGDEGAALLANLEKIVALRKENERIEFEGLDSDKRLRLVERLRNEYEKINAELGVQESKIDPSKTYTDRLAANLDKMEAQYDRILRMADQVGGDEGAAFREQFEALKSLNAELVTEQTRLAEIKHMEGLLNAQISTKKNLIAEVNALRDAGTISEKEAVERTIAINQQTEGGIRANIAALEEFALAMQESLSPEAFSRINAELAQMKAGLNDVTGTFTAMDALITQGTLQGMQTSLRSVITELTNAAIGVQSWRDALNNLGATVAQFFADFLMQIAQAILQQMVLNALAGAGWGGISSAAASLGGVRPATMHNGGTVGDKSSGSGAQSRGSVPASWFAGARRYHSGGFPGLKADEVPAILQKGEQVLSKDDPDNALNNIGKGSTSASGMSARFVLVDDRAKIPEAMNSPEGEQVFTEYLRRNALTVKRIIGS